MLANILSQSVRVNASRTLASQASPLPMPKCDFKPEKYTVITFKLFKNTFFLLKYLNKRVQLWKNQLKLANKTCLKAYSPITNNQFK